MASHSQRPKTGNELSDHSDCTSIATSMGSPDEGYQLTRQPGRTTARHCDTSLSIPLHSNNSTETMLRSPANSETIIAEKEIMTMNIPLGRVKSVQLFLRPDGSVKGISFIYEDADLADLGCCEAEPDCWRLFFRPRYLLFSPMLGYPVGRGFFPVESISFAGDIDGPEPESKAVEMQGSVIMHFSPRGLQMDVGSEVVERNTVEHIELPHETERLETVVAQPTTTPESELQALNNGMNLRYRKRVLKQVRKALKSWFGMRSVIAQLSTRVQQIERRQN